MGSLLSGCPRRKGGLAELGVPDGYEWEGLAHELIDSYYEAKDRVIDELEKSAGSSIDLNEGSWVQRIPNQDREMLKGLLLRRAIGLVHVLKPIEEQRRGIRMMSMKGCLPDNHLASFEHAEELCQNELKSIMEESQTLVPEAPPNRIIQAAVQEYHWQRAAEEAGPGEKGKFEDVKRGFLQGSGKRTEKQMAHGFEIGSEVEAHSLKTESMNGARGRVKGAKGDRVAVTFPAPLGEKALKPNNLRAAPALPDVHPDATEAPATQFQIVMDRARGESLGLQFQHEPPIEKQRPDQESCLLITALLPDGYATKYNAAQQDPSMRVRPGDRILGVMNGMVPEGKRKPISGNSRLIMDVIQTGAAPLIFLVGRVLGPPLRFKVGQQVKANCGERGWLSGVVIKVWEEESDETMVPYVIRLRETGGVVFAPMDNDQFVKKGDPRFKAGDHVMAMQEGGYKKATILTVQDKTTCTSYCAMSGDAAIEIPDDLNRFVRPVARFDKGTEVLAKMSEGYLPGKVEAVYHPNWVYMVRLEAGNVAVFPPEDTDDFVKRR